MSSLHHIAAALLHPHGAAPQGLTTFNGSDPAARLAIHRNNVVSSLVDALADTFPVVQRLVGEDFFRAMAAEFVRHFPPRSPVLAHYGQHLPLFIAGFAPAAALPYLADMARLEMARTRAYHAADAQPVSQDRVALALGCGERIGQLRLHLHPSVATLASPFAVVSLWAAHQRDDELQSPAQAATASTQANMPSSMATALASVCIDAAECALVLRHGFMVQVLPVGLGTVRFVDALASGQGLSAAAEQALAADQGFDLTATLSVLVAHGALIALELPALDALPSV